MQNLKIQYYYEDNINMLWDRLRSDSLKHDFYRQLQFIADKRCAGSVLLWIFPVPLSEWPERGLLPFRKNGWDALSFCEYRT